MIRDVCVHRKGGRGGGRDEMCMRRCVRVCMPCACIVVCTGAGTRALVQVCACVHTCACARGRTWCCEAVRCAGRAADGEHAPRTWPNSPEPLLFVVVAKSCAPGSSALSSSALPSSPSAQGSRRASDLPAGRKQGREAGRQGGRKAGQRVPLAWALHCMHANEMVIAISHRPTCNAATH